MGSPPRSPWRAGLATVSFVAHGERVARRGSSRASCWPLRPLPPRTSPARSYRTTLCLQYCPELICASAPSPSPHLPCPQLPHHAVPAVLPRAHLRLCALSLPAPPLPAATAPRCACSTAQSSSAPLRPLPPRTSPARSYRTTLCLQYCPELICASAPSPSPHLPCPQLPHHAVPAVLPRAHLRRRAVAGQRAEQARARAARRRDAHGAAAAAGRHLPRLLRHHHGPATGWVRRVTAAPGGGGAWVAEGKGQGGRHPPLFATPPTSQVAWPLALHAACELDLHLFGHLGGAAARLVALLGTATHSTPAPYRS